MVVPDIRTRPDRENMELEAFSRPLRLMESRTIDVDAPPLNPKPKSTRPRRSLLLSAQAPSLENELQPLASLSKTHGSPLLGFLSLLTATVCLSAPFLLARFVPASVFTADANFTQKILFVCLHQ